MLVVNRHAKVTRHVHLKVNPLEGRKDFRGEGFELRTDGWGVMRASRGLYISTDARASAQHHQKDVSEAIGNLQGAAGQHEETAKLAEVHKAQEYKKGDCYEKK